MAPTDVVYDSNAWPPYPYKGLSFFTRQDIPLFASRTNEAEECASLLAANDTRVLILYGSTGCGKSSFLRAGLIPFLEADDNGFYFPKADQTRHAAAVFIRSTYDPLAQLATAIFEFTQVPFWKTADQNSSVDISKTTGFPTSIAFREAVGNSSQVCLEAFGKISKVTTKTLVLIIDQGEEVLTLKPAEDGDGVRRRYFDFLARFSLLKLDVKILIAIRKDFYGDFYDEIRKSDADTSHIKGYKLNELCGEALVAAIVRPTSTEYIQPYGVPHSFYRFSYEPRLPERIAQDLRDAYPSGGSLPVMQIICDRLYKITKQAHSSNNSSWTITGADYDSVGGVKGQLEAYLDDVLDSWCKSNSISNSYRRKIERDGWKQALSDLVTIQVGGSILTRVESASRLREIVKGIGCRLNFDDTMAHLSSEDFRIIRPVEVIDSATREPIACFSLGHDALGLALHTWKLRRRVPIITLIRDTLTGVLLWMVGALFFGAGMLFMSEFPRMSVYESLLVLAITLSFALPCMWGGWLAVRNRKWRR
jgi:hypothetical protein